MKIVDSVAKAISDWQLGDLEPALMHACNAVDGTAKKAYPDIKWNNQRFTTLLRANYSILGPMAMPCIDLDVTRFDIDLKNPSASGGKPDLADLIYGIHRCGHNHGDDDMPEGFELIPDASGQSGSTHSYIDLVDGKVRLSDRLIFGLLAIAVFCPVNAHQKSSYGYWLGFNDHRFPINEWWGRAEDFLAVVANENSPVLVITEYSGDPQVSIRSPEKLHVKMYGKGRGA